MRDEFGGLISEGLKSGLFTGFQAAAIHAGTLSSLAGGREGPAAGSPITDETFFDLASLTKPLVALCLLPRIAGGELSWNESLDRWWPGLSGHPFGKVTLAMALAHRTGLPPYREWETEIFPVFGPPVLDRIVSGEGKRLARDRLLELKPSSPAEAVYSDLGYFLLQLVLEEGKGWDLAALVSEGMKALGLGEGRIRYFPVGEDVSHLPVAESGFCQWRRKNLRGEVHDPRAYMVGGVAAWAGLFGTAAALGRLSEKLIDAYGKESKFSSRLKEMIRGDSDSVKGGFTYGFMIPTPPNPLGGRLIPSGAVGHTGYTGTSWWIDFEGRRSLVLLTNFTAVQRDREKFNQWRRRVHDLFWKSRP